jgi:ferrochelatase
MTSLQRFGCRGDLDRIGVLVAQLGSPDEPTPKALRRYLKQFLSDPRVIEANRLVWWLVLNGIILNTRPRRSARLYKRIWWPEGAPLVEITRRQTAALEQRIHRVDKAISIEFGMRYGNPSLESRIDRMLEAGVKRLLIVPMYPQYSAATTASIYDAVFSHLMKRRVVPSIRVMAPFYNDTRYLGALAQTINQGMKDLPFTPERLVLSYHGIPIKYVTRGDTYCCMCKESTEAFRHLIEMEPDKIIHTYQSRFGRDPWLQPYTDETIERLGNEGVKRVAVACPGFTADCLETLDEIGNEALETFHEHGGEELKLIPSVNDQPVFMDVLTELILENLHGWTDPHHMRAGVCQSCPVEAALSCKKG